MASWRASKKKKQNKKNKDDALIDGENKPEVQANVKPTKSIGKGSGGLEGVRGQW